MTVECFTLHNDRGDSVLASRVGDWMTKDDTFQIFGPVVRYSWIVGNENYEKDNKGRELSLHQLPDASGFIGFERAWVPDNCILLDCYGSERLRLTVPWQLTHERNPASARPPSAFVRLGNLHINPINGTEGQFGVNAWVECAGTITLSLTITAANSSGA